MKNGEVRAEQSAGTNDVERENAIRRDEVEVLETRQDERAVEGEVGKDKDQLSKQLNDLLTSKIIVEHHLAYANECVEKNIYPLGLKTFVPCVAYKANEELRKRWKEILHNTSLELLSTLRRHFSKLLNTYNDQIIELETRVTNLAH